MQIKIIGFDTKNGLRLLKNLEKVEKELKCRFNISKISSKNRDKYGIRVTPTLIIEEDIVASGNVLTEREIKNIIKDKLVPEC